MSTIAEKSLRIARRWWANRSDATRALPGLLLSTLRSFGRYSSRQSAALAFFALFSLFPLMLLLAVFIGGLLEPAAAQQQIANGLQVFLPEDEVIVEFVREVFDESLEQSNSFGIIAIMTIVWSSLSLFSNLTASLDEIFRVPNGRNIWKLRLQAIGISLALVLLVIASFLTSGVLRLLSVLQLDQPSLWLSIGIRFLPFRLGCRHLRASVSLRARAIRALGRRAACGFVGRGRLGTGERRFRRLYEQRRRFPVCVRRHRNRDRLSCFGLSLSPPYFCSAPNSART